MAKIIKEYAPDLTQAPAGSEIEETQQSNLDIIEIASTRELDLNNLDEFEYQDPNGVIQFAGVIRDTNEGKTDVKYGFDFGIELGEIPVRKNYENQTPLEIIEDVITNYSRLTFVNNGVTTSRIIPLYSTQGKKAIEVIDDMHSLLGTTHYVDKDKNFTIEFEGTEFNTITLQVGVNCDNQQGWARNTDYLAESLTINGDVSDTSETSFLSGTGSQTEFTIPNPYVDITVEFPIGTELQPKLEGVRDGDYEIFKETKKIVFNTAPASGTDNIKIIYTYQLQANFNLGDIQTSLSNDENPHHKTIDRKYLKTVEDCQDYAYKYREKFGSPIRSATLIYNQSLDNNLFRPNQRIRVIDNQHQIDGAFVDDTFIIKSVTRNFGSETMSLKIEVGDSTQLVYDRDAEIEQRIVDFNESNPTAEIFNEGVDLLDNFNLELQYETTIELLTATLPTNILVHDASRTYTDLADINNPSVTKYIYINNDDFLGLFDSETVTIIITQDGKGVVTQDGKGIRIDD